MKGILSRKMGATFDGINGYALKVCRGHVLRSRGEGTGTKRSMAHPESAEDQVKAAANGGYQARPSNGASIGAWVGDRHLPPVSFGGLVVVDDKTYGMTVHHMLDDPDAEQSTLTPREAKRIQRSMAGSKSEVPDLAAWYAQQYPDESSTPMSSSSSDSGDFAAEFSEAESDTNTESAVTSSYYDSDEEEEAGEYGQPGDIPGVEPGCGDGYIISQPALDDVEENFYASVETQDEEHLDTYSLGQVFASSGIRRRNDERGLIHEIDWALFEFQDDRLPDENSIPRATAGTPMQPRTVLPTTALPNLEVQCMARTSGLQTGLILPALTAVKIYGRTSTSHTYQVTSAASEKPPSSGGGNGDKASRSLPLGLPGDSGAWVVERANGQVCGHVLAFSQRKRVAYICPMDVLLLDIAETLEASEIKLPGGEPVVRMVGDVGPLLSAGGLAEEDEDGDELRSMAAAAAKRRSVMRKGKGSVRSVAGDAAGLQVGCESMGGGGGQCGVGEFVEGVRRMSLGSVESRA